MKLLVIDGNSIFNRAFFGIKLLTTKDGRFTNAIQGFMNILLRLLDECSPDSVAIAFDMHAPTFRHKMYSGYKAQRKGMPPELAQQFPVLKELLTALGYSLIECEGYEADDILGTLGSKSGADECYIATGDRDSLQLVAPGVTVLLASTQMGRPVTKRYTPEEVRQEYGVEPALLIDIKALMGDSSDNIPGVAGVGKKTASDLVASFGGIDNIYEKLDTLDIKPGVREKLRAGRESAYLSRTLGTICLDAPVESGADQYVPSAPNAFEVTRILTDLEMFKLLERLRLPAQPREQQPQKTAQKEKPLCAEEAYDLEKLLEDLRSAGKAYFTSDLLEGSLCALNFAVPSGVLTANSLSLGFAPFVASFLADKRIEKFTDSSKPVYAYALSNNIPTDCVKFDTSLAGYILNPSANNYSVQRLAQEYGVPSPVFKTEPDTSCKDASMLPELCEKLEKLLDENGQLPLLRDIEIPLARVLASMELVGFETDTDGIRSFGAGLDSRISELTDAIYGIAGFTFNLNSPKQLGEALFEKLGLPVKKKTKSGYSTGAEVLESLADDYPIVAMVLEYRTLAKLKSTYCDGMLKVVGADGRIHSTLNQTETRTGRISSTEPNLQNIPVRSELGREMRKFFKAKKGCVLVDADYSQIELRVLADIADDSVMLDAFNESVDIHTLTASQVFNMPVPMVTPLMRSRAKAVNFGIVYGIGAFSLAKDIGVTRSEADSYIKEYLRHYSGVDEYMHKIVESAKANGYVETLFKRRRYLPELSSSNAALRAFGERVARNMPIQGTAADIIKIAMVKAYEELCSRGLSAKLILQVHDELIVEAPENEAEAVEKILVDKMENAVKMKVRLCVDAHRGKTWYDAKG